MTKRSRLVLSASIALVAATGATQVGELARGSGADTPAAPGPVLADYCYVAGAIYVGNTKVYPGGTYCVPAPGA